VSSDNDVYNAEGIAPVGTALELKVLREGKPLTVSAKLEPEQLTTVEGATLDVRLAGAELADANARVRRLDLDGVSVVRVAPGSHAASAGLKAGDLIAGVNQVEIGGLKDLKTLLARRPRQVLLSVVRGRNAFFVPLQ